jgi:hypothetical protein
MRILWSDDPEAPAAYREAIKRAGHPRAILIVDRGNATDEDVSDAVKSFLDREFFDPLLNSNAIVPYDPYPPPRVPLRIYDT